MGAARLAGAASAAAFCMLLLAACEVPVHYVRASSGQDVAARDAERPVVAIVSHPDVPFVAPPPRHADNAIATFTPAPTPAPTHYSEFLPLPATHFTSLGFSNPDDASELFACLDPESCSSNWEARARDRAASAWSCPLTDVAAAVRLPVGLEVPGSQMIMNQRGHAEYEARTDANADAAFDVTGCRQHGVIACIPAHRIVSTETTKNYDNGEDHLCLWAKEITG